MPGPAALASCMENGMENELFRKKSIERIKSPESLNDYIRVTTPGVWMVLSAIILLLVGVCIWGIFGRLDTRVETVVINTGEVMYALVEDKYADRLETENTITVGEHSFKAELLPNEPFEITPADSSYILHLMNKEEGCWVHILLLTEEESSTPLETGTFLGSIVVDSVSPLSFIIN